MCGASKRGLVLTVVVSTGHSVFEMVLPMRRRAGARDGMSTYFQMPAVVSSFFFFFFLFSLLLLLFNLGTVEIRFKFFLFFFWYLAICKAPNQDFQCLRNPVVVIVMEPTELRRSSQDHGLQEYTGVWCANTVRGQTLGGESDSELFTTHFSVWSIDMDSGR